MNSFISFTLSRTSHIQQIISRQQTGLSGEERERQLINDFSLNEKNMQFMMKGGNLYKATALVHNLFDTIDFAKKLFSSHTCHGPCKVSQSVILSMPNTDHSVRFLSTWIKPQFNEQNQFSN